MSKPIAEVKNVSKVYRQGDTEIEVLKELSFEIHAGETVAVLGQSGSGKSTFLSILAGLDRPTTGNVALCGEDILKLSEKDLARVRSKNLGIVFQQFHLMSYLNAWENVSLPLDLAHLQTSAKNTVKDAQKKAWDALKSVGLEHRLHHLPQQLSGGEKQRVTIARAFVTQPSLLLADEPSGSLDPKTGQDVLELLFKQAQVSQMAMVLVTHNEALAERCDRRLRLSQGKLISV